MEWVIWRKMGCTIVAQSCPTKLFNMFYEVKIYLMIISSMLFIETFVVIIKIFISSLWCFWNARAISGSCVERHWMIINILSRVLTRFLTKTSSIKSCSRDIFSNILFQRPIKTWDLNIYIYIYLFRNINPQIAWKNI